MKNNNSFSQEDAYLRAEKRLRQIKVFYWHLFWYIAVNLFIIVSMAINQGDLNIFNFATFSTAIFWGIGLAVHGLTVFGKNLVFSKTWEQRKIQEYIEKEHQNWE